MSETNESGKRDREEDETDVEAPPPKATKSVSEAEAEESETAPENPDNPGTVPEESNGSEPSKKTTNEGVSEETEVDVADSKSEVAEETEFIVDRKGEEMEERKDETKEEEKALTKGSAPAEMNIPRHEPATQNAPAPLSADVGPLPPPISAVNPTIQATVMNPDQIVEERGEIPALYVGKVIGKVRTRSKKFPFVLSVFMSNRSPFNHCFARPRAEK